jgi:hypothetical protein
MTKHFDWRWLETGLLLNGPIEASLQALMTADAKSLLFAAPAAFRSSLVASAAISWREHLLPSFLPVRC